MRCTSSSFQHDSNGLTIALSPDSALRDAIDEAILRMEANISDPRLKTHRLSGRLHGYHACSAGYDCRIIFSRERIVKTKTEYLVLIDVGSHDDVY
jgi:mRNA interferase YafQ